MSSGKQIKNKTLLFDGREARTVVRSGQGLFIWNETRKGMFLFLLMKNKVNNALALCFR